MTNWHRLFGLALMDLFTGSSYVVELEQDLSYKRQFVDVIIIEQEGGTPPPDLPDGLANLARHNLLTYKSLREPLDQWTLDELLGHYVNYRKKISPGDENLLPVEDFRLYAVCTRYPQKLLKEIPVVPIQQAVYDVHWGSRDVRIIVLSEMPPTPHNALWELFSANPEKVQYGAAHYRWHAPDYSTSVYELYHMYQVEGMAMSYTWNDFYYDFTKEHVDKLTIKDRLAGLSIDDVINTVSREELLKRLFAQMTPEELEAYLKQRRAADQN